MIPKEIIAYSLLISAPINGWNLEVMTTNWPGYWIFQISHELENQPSLAMLINLDNLALICQAMRSCIDKAYKPSISSRQETMIVMAASQLPTPENDKGAVTIMSEWASDPTLTIIYYRGGQGDGNRISQSLALDDAMDLSNMLAKVYNSFEDKKNWEPRATNEVSSGSSED
jgi:hypothetical protein